VSTRHTIEEVNSEALRSAKRTRKREKLEKWSGRAAAHGINFASLSKAERREFRARWRVNRALDRLEKVVGGSKRRDVNEGARLAKAAGARSERLTDAEIRGITVARAGRSL
jgi:hypothetical protein